MSICLDLVRFADGELDPERAAAFREHLRTCEACQPELIELMQLSAQLSTLVSRDAPGQVVDVPPPVVPNAVPYHPPPRWKRGAIWASAALASAGGAIGLWLCTMTPSNAFAGRTTRPYQIRIAYADAAGHRPTRDVSLGAGATPGTDRIPFSALDKLERRHDEHGLAIARLWNGDKPGDVIKQLSELPQTAPVRSDRAAMQVLTTSPDNAEPVLAELEALRGSSDAAVARAARWNYALLLARMDLPLSAAQAFQAIARDHEPGWAEEAAQLAAPQTERGKAFKATWQQAFDAGNRLLADGTPVPGELVGAVPGMLRAYFYNGVRTAPTRERVQALAAMASELDRLGDPGQHTLHDYVERVARLDFTRRAPLAAAYAALLRGEAVTEPLATQLTTETSSADIADIVMGGMVERGVAAEHRAWFAAMAERSGDRWFQIVLARAEADVAMARGDWQQAEAVLRNAQTLCSPALGYECLTVERRLGKLYSRLQRIRDSLTVLRSALRTARTTGEWGRYGALLWQLADVERFHSATATVRAYVNELLLVTDDCENRKLGNRTLAGAALLDVDGPAARRYLNEALKCGPPDLLVATYLSDIGRLDRRPEDLAQLQDMLSKVRANEKLTASERVLADEIEGRLLVERDRGAGIPLLRKAIAAADELHRDVVADKARAAAYSVLAFDAARTKDHAGALSLIAQDLGLSPPRACVVGMAAEDERAVVVVRGSDGKDAGLYDPDRRPSRGVLTVPAGLGAGLAGCAHVDVMAVAALQGQPRVLPPELAWSYVADARDRSAPASPPPHDRRTLIVANVTPPPYLDLHPLAIQPPDDARATLLAGSAATPTRVIAAMADATEIQFHTHALMDVGVSDASHLVLSPEAPGGSYALTAEAIRRTQLRGHPVVVLAACHSAQGARYQHEPWSLPAALLAVGARAVFAAATDIPDLAAGQFFTGVLARVRGGADPATALRDERLAALRADPRSWIADVIVFE